MFINKFCMEWQTLVKNWYYLVKIRYLTYLHDVIGQECETELKQMKKIPQETIANIVENKKKLDLARVECRYITAVSILTRYLPTGSYYQ